CRLPHGSALCLPVPYTTLFRSVTVHAVAPSLVRTPRTDGRAVSPGGVSGDEEVAAVLRGQAVKRLQQPQDVADVVAYLASEESADGKSTRLNSSHVERPYALIR